ncbi:MAG: ribosome assembly cofactor RimP [Bacteroidota bacterium]|jgi:ribosome maturation factor RimP
MLSTANQQLFKTLLQQAIEGADVFLVEIKFTATEKVEIYLDSDSGVTIEKCTKVARFINKQLEEQQPELMYELEVSSAGLEHPLQSLRQYQKNIGRTLEVNMPDGKLFEGKLLSADESGFSIEARQKQKRENKTFKYDEVKEVFVGVSFN